MYPIVWREGVGNRGKGGGYREEVGSLRKGLKSESAAYEWSRFAR